MMLLELLSSTLSKSLLRGAACKTKCREEAPYVQESIVQGVQAETSTVHRCFCSSGRWPSARQHD